MRERAVIPFLRSPSFPGVPDEVAAVSLPAVEGAAPVSDDMLGRIAEARIGGSFWGTRIGGFRFVAREGLSFPAGWLREEVGVLARAGGGSVKMLPHDCDPWTLVEGAKAVLAEPDDELAMVAALSGVAVVDADGAVVSDAVMRDEVKRSLSCARYRTCFAAPGEDDGSELEDVIAILSDWRRHFDGNRGIGAAAGMAFWKRKAIRQLLWDGRAELPLLKAGAALRRARGTGMSLAVWPSRIPASLRADAERAGVPVIQVEDGFLRSRGLGAALHPPGSVVLDRSGIYFDATRPSDLETLLATHDFPPALLARAARLRERLCASGVTKYGASDAAAVVLPQGRRTVMAIGQVEDDLSVRLGGAGITDNLEFLRRVRTAEPDAWIVYRPHPDVMAGHRKGQIPDALALEQVDVIDANSPLMPMVERVDEVHVLSSLTGFEALLRGRSVTVHGQPFYAGWGLTRDLAPPIGRRGRQLGVDALVAAALILYPRYVDPLTQLPCGPETMVERLASGHGATVNWLVKARIMQGRLRRYMDLALERLRG